MNDFTHLVIRNVDDRYDSPVFMVPYKEAPGTRGARYRMTLERFDQRSNQPEDVFEVGFMSSHQAERYFPEVHGATIAKGTSKKWVEATRHHLLPQWEEDSIAKQTLPEPLTVEDQYVQDYLSIVTPNPSEAVLKPSREEIVFKAAKEVQAKLVPRNRGKWVQRSSPDGYEAFYISSSGKRQRTRKGFLSYQFKTWDRALAYAVFRAEHANYANELIIEKLFPEVVKVYRAANIFDHA